MARLGEGRGQRRRLLSRALEAGINFFDTADFYSAGASEEVTGKHLKAMARREEIVMATKVGLKMGKGPNQQGLSRKHIMEGIDASLKRLGTDYVDLYQIHRLDRETSMEEICEALDAVVKAGKALYIGASSHVGLAVHEDAGDPAAKRFRPLRLHAKSLQPPLPRGRA